MSRANDQNFAWMIVMLLPGPHFSRSANGLHFWLSVSFSRTCDCTPLQQRLLDENRVRLCWSGQLNPNPWTLSPAIWGTDRSIWVVGLFSERQVIVYLLFASSSSVNTRRTTTSPENLKDQKHKNALHTERWANDKNIAHKVPRLAWNRCASNRSALFTLILSKIHFAVTKMQATILHDLMDKRTRYCINWRVWSTIISLLYVLGGK